MKIHEYRGYSNDGVLQGSVLGLILCLIYSNDLNKDGSCGQVTGLADDTVLCNIPATLWISFRTLFSLIIKN